MRLKVRPMSIERGVDDATSVIVSVTRRCAAAAMVYLHQGLLGTPSQGLGIVGRFAVGRGRITTFVVIVG